MLGSFLVLVVLVLVLVLVQIVLILIVRILILILVPLLLSHVAVAAAAGTSERAPLVSAQAGMITEHRMDAVEQEPAADHARCRRCGRTEKR